ncbi:MAG TPA: MBOAT family protein [Bryobacteraceae bacterium]|jgi:D-alanyl-lipoteichoic acid acyltransferase DltB (MBOAT superfamily)|nr:MBOAT family protein [Bryobacteraceae bacterium]
MLFTTLTFVAFLIVVLALFYVLQRPARRYLLLAASLFFYMAWNAKFVILILGLITVDYFAALWISRREEGQRRIALLVSLAANIGMLGWFKYANFARETWLHLIHPGIGVQPLDIILPLGISFHTFQSISYVIDVYRGEQKAVTSYVDYALFVAFFPQLVAGPIVRAREFFRDLWNWKPPTGAEWQQGFALILTGYVKKLVFADQFALVADKYFGNPTALPGMATAWTGTLAFALQIFFDFSGYTDIAIGVALLFGFHFPENFRRPYLSASITEFWRRWHMTLSRWLRDYIYIPLGGNRRGTPRTYLNLMLTMLLGGLWHGASWNFVIWGGYHGALLSIERMIWGRREHTGLARIPLTAITFALACIGWVFFRAKTFEAARFVLAQMFTGVAGPSLFSAWQWRLALIALAIALAEEYGHLLTRLAEIPAWARAGCMVLVLLVIELFSATDQSIPFVYFQF